MASVRYDFYPRPPRGGRRLVDLGCGGVEFISIHALREEGDLADIVDVLRGDISIHALREEGDLHDSRRAGNSYRISIHALREEGDSAHYRMGVDS